MFSLPLIETAFDTREHQERLYPRYARWRAQSPVFGTKDGGVYLAGYEECLALLTQPRFARHSPETGELFPDMNRSAEPFKVMLDHWLVFMDRPRHELLRACLLPHFTATALEVWQEEVRRRVQVLLAGLPLSESVDWVQAFALQLPVQVIMALLGLPESDASLFTDWARELALALDAGTPETLGQGAQVAQDMLVYFQAHVARRTSSLPDASPTLIDRMLEHRRRGEMTEQEVIHGCGFMLWAGHETTRHLLANGLYTLAQQPAAWALLRQDPTQCTRAVEEILRYESPLQKLSRWTMQPVQLGGVDLPANTLVTALIGAANRDPAVFDEPERFDVARTANRHLAFGKGTHHCLGATLARWEARIALEALLERVTAIELEGYEWRCASAFRSLESLQVNLRPV